MKLTELELTRLGDRKWLRSDFVKEVRVRLSAAGLKYCPSCAQVLPVEDFGGRGYCNPCYAKKSGKYYAKNREAVSHRRKVYRDHLAAVTFTPDDGSTPDLLADDFDDREMNN